MPRGVVGQRGFRTTPASPTLIEHNDPIAGWIKKAARANVPTTARPAVNEYGDLPIGITALLIIDGVLTTHLEETVIEWLQRGIESAANHGYDTWAHGRRAVPCSILGGSGVAYRAMDTLFRLIIYFPDSLCVSESSSLHPVMRA